MIDPKKQYRTRDGREVRIYAVDGGENGSNVHGAIRWEWGWGATHWYPHGGYLSGTGDPRDLIEVKPRIKRKAWVNVYPGWEHAYSTKRDAEIGSGQNRIACVEIDIDVEEGHGL